VIIATESDGTDSVSVLKGKSLPLKLSTYQYSQSGAWYGSVVSSFNLTNGKPDYAFTIHSKFGARVKSITAAKDGSVIVGGIYSGDTLYFNDSAAYIRP